MKYLLSIVPRLVKSGLGHLHLATLVYVFQLMLALLLGAQVYQVLESSIGKSLSIQQLLHGYDHTVWTDFLKVHGASVTPLLGQLRWLILLYFIFSVFIEAGAMYAIMHYQKSIFIAYESVAYDYPKHWSLFWEGGAKYFGRFLKISTVFLLISGVISAAIWLPILGKLNGWLENTPSEIPVVLGVLAAVIVYLLLLCLLYTWSVLTKLQIIRAELTTWQAIKQGWVSLWKDPYRYLLALFLYICLAILLFWLATKLEIILAPLSAMTIWLVVLAQQAVAWLRMVLRMGLYQFWSKPL